MLLAIDAGNTNTVFAVCKDKKIVRSWRCQTVAGRTGDEYASWMIPLFQQEKLKFEDVNHVIISSVVPEANFNLGRFCETYLKKTPYFVKSGETDFGIKVLLDEPKAAGSDRLINAVAAHAFHRTPAIVIDFGTSTNFDVVDKDGSHIGGALAIGLNLSLNALHMAASKLPKVDIKQPPKAIGTNTIHAMQSGLYWGYVGLINGLINKLSAELPEKPYIIATGGLARVFEKDIPALDIIDDDLTLKGLIEVWTKNNG